MEHREELSGGRIGKIMKEGESVVRPAQRWTADIHRFLTFMHQRGARFVPEPYAITEQQQELLSYMPGEVYNDPLPAWMLEDRMLISAARLLKTFHEHSQHYIRLLTQEEPWMLTAQQPAEVMCHGDFAPYNVTIVDGEAAGIIDFDTLHPGPRLWDVAYAVYRWVPLTSPARPGSHGDLQAHIQRTRLFLDVYGMDNTQRDSLVPVLIARLTSLTDFMQHEANNGNEDFQHHIAEGHLQVYVEDMDYLRRHEDEIVKGIRG